MAERIAERPGSLLESHKGYDPRVMTFYALLGLLLLVLAGGLAVQQLRHSGLYQEREKVQNQRRILVPGPRGNIYDREGRLLVGNRPRFAVTLYLDELRSEISREAIRIRRNYRTADDQNLPNRSQIDQIARYTVVQRYLDQVNRTLGRDDKVQGNVLARHFHQQLLLPFMLVDDLSAEEYAKLIEQLPVTSPLQVYTSSTRFYPYGAAASHALGYVSVNDDITAPEDLSGGEFAEFTDKSTFRMKGSIGKTGLEARFDELLQGATGGTIYRVDPAGYRIEPPLERRLPVQGKNVTTSIDADLQAVADQKLAENEMAGAAVALDVHTGEVLVLSSAPDYDLNDSSPRWSTEKYAQVTDKGGWLNHAVQGTYPPGSSFKILTSIAGMRAGALTPDSTVDCPGYYMVGRKRFVCHDGHAHGHIGLVTAIEKSCNVFFYKYGLDAGPDAIAAEARRFHFDEPTGVELPHETTRMLVPDPAWKLRARDDRWAPGDTANYSIGQGFLDVTPMQMATFMASFARKQTVTKPTLIHQREAPRQNTEPINLPPAYYNAIVAGMEQCVISPGGTARSINVPKLKIQGLRIAGKTGTAQKRTPQGTVNFAWFICFAPVENPQIAIAVMVAGDTPNEETGGGTYAAPVAHGILKTWWEKKNRPANANPLIVSQRD